MTTSQAYDYMMEQWDAIYNGNYCKIISIDRNGSCVIETEDLLDSPDDRITVTIEELTIEK